MTGVDATPVAPNNPLFTVTQLVLGDTATEGSELFVCSLMFFGSHRKNHLW